MAPFVPEYSVAGPKLFSSIEGTTDKEKPLSRRICSATRKRELMWCCWRSSLSRSRRGNPSHWIVSDCSSRIWPAVDRHGAEQQTTEGKNRTCVWWNNILTRILAREIGIWVFRAHKTAVSNPAFLYHMSLPFAHVCWAYRTYFLGFVMRARRRFLSVWPADS